MKKREISKRNLEGIKIESLLWPLFIGSITANKLIYLITAQVSYFQSGF